MSVVSGERLARRSRVWIAAAAAILLLGAVGLVRAQATGATLAVSDLVGTGDPEGTISAPIGSVWRRTDGGSGSTFYVKESGSSSTGWRSLAAGLATDAKTRTAGNLTLTSDAAFTADVDTNLDLTVPAESGDVVGLSVSGLWGAEIYIGHLDFVTRVSSADVNFVSSGTSTPVQWGVMAWRGENSYESTMGGSYLYTVQSGDISGGNVTFRLRYKNHTSGGTKTLYASSTLPLRVQAVNYRH